MKTIRIRSVGLSDEDVKKLTMIQALEGVRSRSEVVRRLIDRHFYELRRYDENKE
jgi:hypothetical protein